MRRDRPGYMSRKRNDGSTAHYWSPQRAIKGAPDYLEMRRIDDSLDDAGMAAQCQLWADQLRADMETMSAPLEFDGTIGSLINHYLKNEESPLRKVKASTRRKDYEPSLKILVDCVGKRRIDKLVASDFRRWFNQWMPKGHRRAFGAMKLLRIVLTYGTGERLHGCEQARVIISTIRFEHPEQRQVSMTFEQCEVIVKAAIQLGDFSVAFVEALKFETALRRIDVIGEWIPNGRGDTRWTGLTVGQISKDLVLTLKTSKTGSKIVRDLKKLPLVMLALQHYKLPEIGPVVIREATGKPWREQDYPEFFRAARDLAGVPDNVWSMDSRSGAISEAKIATGSIDKASDFATHSGTKMTRKYIRQGDLEESSEIADARSVHRGLKRQ